MLLATFLDPNENGLNIVDLATLLGVIVSAVSAVVVVMRFIRKVLREEIVSVVDEKLSTYTQQIQPGYRNGGGSLTDIGEGVKEILKQLSGDRA